MLIEDAYLLLQLTVELSQTSFGWHIGISWEEQKISSQHIRHWCQEDWQNLTTNVIGDEYKNNRQKEEKLDVSCNRRKKFWAPFARRIIDVNLRKSCLRNTCIAGHIWNCPIRNSVNKHIMQTKALIMFITFFFYFERVKVPTSNKL